MRTCLFAASAILLASVAPVAAAAAVAAPVLPEVVVSASVEPAEARALPASVQVITTEQLVQSGATNLEQALERFVPGNGYIQPGALNAVGLRGFRSNQNAGTTIGDRVLVLIDGHRAGTGNPGVLPLANVERVEVVRGPASVVYGGSAMGGVINLITRKGKGAPKGAIGASYGSFDRATGEAAVASGLADDRYGYAFAVQGDRADNYKDGNGTRYANTHYANLAAGGTATFRPEADTNLSLVAAHQSVFDTGSPGYYPVGLTPSDRVNNAYNYLALEYDATLDSDYSLRGSLYASQNRYNIFDAQYGGGNSTYRSQTLGGRGVVGIPLGDFGRLSVGGDYAHVNDKSYGESVWQPNSVYDILGLFAEHRFHVGDVSLNYGVRYDLYRTRIHQTDQLDVHGDNQTYAQLSWNAGATWWVLDWLGLRASAGSAFVPPTAKTLSGEFSTGGLWARQYRGNPDLRPEKNISGEVGLEVDYNAFRASLAYFHTRYTDRISEVFAGDYTTFRNTGRQYLAGFDVSMDWIHELDMGRDTPLVFTPYANGEFYTLRKNRDHSPVLAVPAYSAVLGLGLGYDRVHLDLNARLTGPQKQNDTVSPYAPTRVTAFETCNARLTINATEALSVYLDAQNLMNRQYAYTVGYPMPGRAVSAGFRYTF